MLDHRGAICLRCFSVAEYREFGLSAFAPYLECARLKVKILTADSRRLSFNNNACFIISGIRGCEQVMKGEMFYVVAPVSQVWVYKDKKEAEAMAEKNNCNCMGFADMQGSTKQTLPMVTIRGKGK